MTGIAWRTTPSRCCDPKLAGLRTNATYRTSSELSTQSETFRTRWAAHNVRYHDTGVKRLHQPVVGELTLSYETMKLTADPELTMFAYTAEPGSKSEEALNLLASWTATLDRAVPANVTDEA